MREWIYGRNAVMEVLQARRREVFTLLLATGIEDKGRIQEIQKLAIARKCKVERVPKERLAKMGENPQGVALEVSGYPYVNLADILDECPIEKRGSVCFIAGYDPESAKFGHLVAHRRSCRGTRHHHPAAPRG